MVPSSGVGRGAAGAAAVRPDDRDPCVPGRTWGPSARGGHAVGRCLPQGLGRRDVRGRDAALVGGRSALEHRRVLARDRSEGDLDDVIPFTGREIDADLDGVRARALETDDAPERTRELARLGGYERLRDQGVPEDGPDEVAEAAAARPGAGLTRRRL